jgi:integrase
MSKRIKTDYKGVFYREGLRRTVPGSEKIFYIVFKKSGKLFEEVCGRQYEDQMTAAKANLIRSARIENRRQSKKEIREADKKKKGEIIYTIEKLWDFYSENKPLKGIKQDKCNFNKWIKPHFGNKMPENIVPLDLERLKGVMKKAGKSAQTIKLNLALLRRVCNYGYKKGKARPLSFPIDREIMPKVNNLKTEDLAPEQIKSLFKAIDDPESHIIGGQMMKMVLFSGLRRGELLKLTWKDIDKEKGFILLRDPKGATDMRIPLNEQTRVLLDSITKTSDYVFPGRKGGQRVEIHKAVKAIADKAGLPEGFRPLHGLRHVYASMLASSGAVDLYTISKLLTHKDSKVTQRYAHLRDDAFKRGADLAGTLIDEIVKKKSEAGLTVAK